MTTREAGLKYRKIPSKHIGVYVRANHVPAFVFRDTSAFMTSKSPPPPQSVEKKPPCKHPRVQIVSRDEDAEFVECLECGEIFESSEFKDMSIEERAQSSDL